ncbi:MAG: molybdopterin-binding protein [Syntrophomonadaceae bacterium]|jgi:molybdopterin-biosynthesis enzyme MoeA-like protein
MEPSPVDIKGGIEIRASVITVSCELLLGKIINSNLAFLAKKLTEYGFDVVAPSN